MHSLRQRRAREDSRWTPPTSSVRCRRPQPRRPHRFSNQRAPPAGKSAAARLTPSGNYVSGSATTARGCRPPPLNTCWSRSAGPFGAVGKKPPPAYESPAAPPTDLASRTGPLADRCVAAPDTGKVRQYVRTGARPALASTDRPEAVRWCGTAGPQMSPNGRITTLISRRQTARITCRAQLRERREKANHHLALPLRSPRSLR